MKGGFLCVLPIFYATFLLSRARFSAAENSVQCDRKCGSRTVPYPFGFSGGCLNRLECLHDGNMTVAGFKVENITADGIIILHMSNCNQSLQQMAGLLHKYYSLTSNNVLLVQNCENPVSGCAFSARSLIKNFAPNETCSMTNFSCLSSYTEGYMPWWNLNHSSCDTLLTNMIVDARDPAQVTVDFGRLELGWWVNGPCSKCATNAACVRFPSPLNKSDPAHRCRCNDGFEGDGFPQGDGCRKGSPRCNASKYMSGHCGGTTRVAVLIGGLLGGATLVAVIVLVYCFFKKSACAFESRRSRQRLLSANGGSFTVPIFTYRELEKATKGFSEKERLGNGAFGTVYAGKLQSNRWVAVKKIRQRDTHGIEQVMNEIKVLSSVEHPNLVRLMGCCLEKGEPILVYEYMPNGTLSQHLQRERGEGLSWTHRITVAAETARALAYLHSAVTPPIYHRDVKSSNILLDYAFNSKVADFGLSKLVLTESSHISTVPQGTPGYLDPQYHQTFHLSDKSDVYSFGVVLVEIITALKVVDFTRHKNEINLAALAINRIGRGFVDEIIDPILDLENNPWVRVTVHRVAELAFRCLAFDRDARPTMLEVAEELDDIREHAIETKPPQSIVDTSLSDDACSACGDEEDKKSRRHSTDTIKQSRRSSEGSRKIVIQSPLMDELKDVIIRKMESASPVSVQDPWVSGQSSPSTSSLLDNAIQ